MLYELVHNFPDEILFETEGPFISLYQPTFKVGPDNKQDIIRFKNLTKEIEQSLLQKYTKAEVSKLLEPFQEIADDKSFWINASDGLCVLSVKNKTVVYKLTRPVEELAIVSNSFHIKPLLRVFQSTSRYHILGLGRKSFVLYEGDRYGFQEIPIDEDVPRTMVEVLGDQYTPSYLSTGGYGGKGGVPIYHGSLDKNEEAAKDVEKYFRYVDKFVTDNYSNVEKLPLILMALPENQGIFRGISNNTYLLEKGITRDYENLNIEEITKDAWEVIEPIYLEKTKDLVDKFENSRAQSLGSDDLSQIARAAFENRIDTLLIEADRIEPGKISRENGELIKANLENPDIDDILDDLAEMVLKDRGNVVILPKERIPSTTGAAAIFRY